MTTLFGLVAMVFVPVFLGYALLLWIDGVPNPFAVVTASWVGKTWLAILICGGVAMRLSALYTRRADIIPALRYARSCLQFTQAFMGA